MKHGTYIADMAYLSEFGKYKKVGALVFFRGAVKPHAKFRIDRQVPVDVNIIGLYLAKSEEVLKKFDEAPFVDGDMFSVIHGELIKVGHIHSDQNETGETIYWARFSCDMSQANLPAWVRIELE